MKINYKLNSILAVFAIMIVIVGYVGFDNLRKMDEKTSIIVGAGELFEHIDSDVESLHDFILTRDPVEMAELKEEMEQCDAMSSMWLTALKYGTESEVFRNSEYAEKWGSEELEVDEVAFYPLVSSLMGGIEESREQYEELHFEIITLHEEEISAEMEFNALYIEEKTLRHNIDGKIREAGSWDLIDQAGKLSYTSKEALFQYRDEKHSRLWLDSIMALKESIEDETGTFTESEKESLLKDIDEYRSVAVKLSDLVLLIENNAHEEKIKMEKLEGVLSDLSIYNQEIDEAIKKYNEETQKDTKSFLLSIIGLTIILGFIMILSISRSISIPIIQYRDAARQISEGNFEKRVDRKGRGEISDLGESLNIMAEKLKRYYNHLEEEVEKRTAQLEEQSEELTAMNEELTAMNEELVSSNEELAMTQNELKDMNENLESLVEEKTIELRSAYEKLKDVDKLKNNIMSNVSHELKTPITIVQTSIELACEENDPVERNSILMSALDALRRQINIVDDLLAISMIRTSLPVKKLDSLQELIKVEMDRKQELADSVNVSLCYEPSPGLPEVPMDSDQIGHVIRNLIDNAIKFSHNGDRVEIRAKKIGHWVDVSVSDEGVGIKGELLENLFQPLTQLDPSTRRRFGGTGNGLAVAKSIIEAQGGRIWVESEHGKGSTFFFSLPLELEKIVHLEE